MAGGGAPAPAKTNFEWQKSELTTVGERFLNALGLGQVETAYKAGDELLRETRSLKVFKEDMAVAGFTRFKSVVWENGVPSKDGYRLTGTIVIRADGEEKTRSIPFYMNLIGDEHLPPKKRASKGRRHSRGKSSISNPRSRLNLALIEARSQV